MTDSLDADDVDFERKLPSPRTNDLHTSSDRWRMAGSNGLSLWSFKGSLIVTFFASVVALAGLIFLAAFWLGFPKASPNKPLAIGDEFDLIKIVLGIIAGAGGVVALVVAYRRQRVLEYSARLEHERERREDVKVLNERFATAASQLGNDNAAVRLAGVYAMAGLADDWSEQRQTCIDVLCAFLRMPYSDEPEKSGSPGHVVWLHQQMVRHTVIRVIASHLQNNVLVSWHGYNFDFSGAVFDGGDFSGCDFRDVYFNFAGARFVGGETSFIGSRFSDCELKFDWVQLIDGSINFGACDILDDSQITFIAANIDKGTISFGDAVWDGSRLKGGVISFSAADLREEGAVLFWGAECTGTRISFAASHFLGGRVLFMEANLGGGEISFEAAKFNDGIVDFEDSDFVGSVLNFHDAKFSGTRVDFTKHREWAVQPKFDKWETPPVGLQLPHGSVDA